MENKIIRTDQDLDLFEALGKPVANDEVRVVVIGAMGTGKSHILLTIQKALAEKMPGSNVTLVNGDMPPALIAEYVAQNVSALALEHLSAGRIKNVTLYELPTNKRGQIKGHPQKIAEKYRAKEKPQCEHTFFGEPMDNAIGRVRVCSKCGAEEN